MKRGKKYVEAAKAVDRATLYDAPEAISLVKKAAVAKFDETIEVHIRTGCDGRHADQQIRGAVVLPHGTGKKVRVLVFAKDAKAEEAKAAGADVEVLRAMGGSANSLLWTQIKSDITGKPIVVPSSDTATTLGAAILAGVGVGMYQDYDEAIRLTVKETRRHEPNPENRDVYEKTYKTYLNLYKSLEPMMRNEEEK